MNLELFMLGTGNAFAKKYYNTNSLWSTGQFTLLVDCGITAPLSLYQAGKSWSDIDGVLITHLHADHIGGLEELAFRMKFEFRKKIPLFISHTLIDSLWNHSLKAGLEDEVNQSLEDFFDVVPLTEGNGYRIADGITVCIIRTDHIAGKDSYSLIINDDIFYSADMKFDEDLLKKLYYEQHCKLFIHDCQLNPPGAVHTTLEELRTLPDEIQRNLHLMHYEDHMEAYIGQTGVMRFVKQHQRYIIDEHGLHISSST